MLVGGSCTMVVSNRPRVTAMSWKLVMLLLDQITVLLSSRTLIGTMQIPTGSLLTKSFSLAFPLLLDNGLQAL